MILQRKEMNKKIKICMVVPNPMVKGGIASVVNGYRGSILEKDFEIIYVESYRDGSKVQKLFKGVCGYLQFVKVLLLEHPDLIHIHSSFGPSFYRKMPFVYMSSWVGKPIINHIHGAEFETFFGNASKKKKRLVRKVYGKCNRLIALSEEWKQLLKQIVPEEKITIIENYSILHREALQDRLNRACNNRVLFLGELGKRKGCYDIPAVVEQVVQEIPEVKFVLAGSGTIEDETVIKKIVEKKGILRNVEFPGWLRGQEKEKALYAADLFFLPSYNEGMPMSVLDAMGYGLPIVSTEVGGIPKIVRNGVNGYCCKAGDSIEMAKGIISILKNRDERYKMAQESFKISEEKYSLEHHIQCIEKIYNMVMGIR